MKPAIKAIVEEYPRPVQLKFKEIRTLIVDTARNNQLGEIEETLKWGQPSYLCASGSTIRLAWQSQDHNNLKIFFNCNTILVETFREVFGDSLCYEGNRVVMVPVEEPVPQELENCVLMALNYHTLKKKPLLGA